ncbi:hypothetical protein [Montanilutibacter psychrotolerans]|uniref:Uncharacterized protein n=1 Tax=Montanilutibacter psychrotolerans TaxID=1327343 RepID=A0A3M8SUK6_9GAMM|nr:hypothetical protein [Lysobacter psychrotolerans]RNF84473.1 hypothetical protein EER27_08890 [Lysobacter psychrotolerans]
MKLINLLTLTVAFAASFSAVAKPTYPCHGCTPEQVADLAWQTLSAAGAGDAYYVDYVNGKAYRLANQAPIPDMSNPEPEPYFPDIVFVPIDPAIVAFAENMRVLTNGNNLQVYEPAAGALSFRSNAVTPSSGGSGNLPANSYELMKRTDLEYNLSSHLMQTEQGIRGYIFGVIGALTQSGFDYSKAPAVIVYRFRDGGSAKFRLDMTVQKYVRVPGETYDGHGNRIPETKEDFYGHVYQVGPSNGPEYDYNYLAERAGLLGHQVYSGPISGFRIAYACTPDGCAGYIVAN